MDFAGTSEEKKKKIKQDYLPKVSKEDFLKSLNSAFPKQAPGAPFMPNE
jgi:hypothetical protein